MAYFPLFMDIADSTVLIVGGGKVAERKIEKLLPFGCRFKVVAPSISDEIRKIGGIELHERKYTIGDEDGSSIAIAATDDRNVNRMLSEECRKKGIPANVVDDPELCSFIFPSIVKKGKLTIGISTSGSSPTAAIEIRKSIEEMIPSSFDEILDYLHSSRETVKKKVSDEGKRHEVLKEIYRRCMKLERALTDNELDDILDDVVTDR